MYFRSLRREKVAQVLNNKVAMFVGEGWQNCPFIQSTHHLCTGAMDFRATQNLMGKAQLLINDIPGFPKGSHERPLYAMGQGCLVLTSTNEWFKQEFTDREHLLFCNSELNLLAEKLDFYEQLSADSKTAIAQAGYEITKRSHRWANRLEQAKTITKERTECSIK